MLSFNWLRNHIDRIKQARRAARAYVQCDESGFTLHVNGKVAEQTQQLGWDRISGVFAYKSDCFSVDQICLAIGEELKRWIEVTEDDEGYQQLIEQLPKRLAGFPTLEEWWQKSGTASICDPGDAALYP